MNRDKSSEIKDIVNHKIDKNILKMSKLFEFKDNINKELYEMYNDIPEKELGSTNILCNLSYEKFYQKCLDLVKEEYEINNDLNTTTKRYILKINDLFIGEVGIRTTLNDFWKNKGSQIYYKIRKSERGKGYGNIILELALAKAKDLGFKQIRINCDNKNLPSKKVILKKWRNNRYKKL